ncbi:MAG: hypothetical protein L0H64_02745 [Pseudonocardia sp.]|nr:hypothetical protein [Pseudonocardia sp.]
MARLVDDARIGYRLDGIVEQDAVGRLATARMIASGDVALGVVVDIHFATAGIEAEIVAAAEVHEVLPDLWMPVATAGHLVALKLFARDDETRPQDAADLRALQCGLDAVDHRMVRAAVGLIVEAGVRARSTAGRPRRGIPGPLTRLGRSVGANGHGSSGGLCLRVGRQTTAHLRGVGVFGRGRSTDTIRHGPLHVGAGIDGVVGGAVRTSGRCRVRRSRPVTFSRRGTVMAWAPPAR